MTSRTTTFIYALLDGEIVRYIGKTHKIKERLNEHINEARNGVNTRKNRWILSLLKNNKMPDIEIIDEVLIDEWTFWEKFYIGLYKSWGFDLTNMTIGGNGTGEGVNNPNYGRVLTEEHKKKCSIKLSGKNNPFYGKKHSDEILQKFYKSVLQYTINGEFLKEWKSIHDAESTLHIHSISSCCGGKLLSAGGYVWKYKSNNIIDQKILINKVYRKPVYQYTKKGIFIKKWNSVREAEGCLNINHISKVCTGYKSHKTTGGFIWKYV
jgi:NUMOD3 motif/GIY-YIG catalytic domain/NUMOD1 domain